VEVRTEPVPALKPGELLVASTRTLISTGTESIVLTKNFTDENASWANWARYPFRAGYLHVGRVLAVGSEVAGWTTGDRVATRQPHASHVVVDAGEAVHIPENVSDEEATWMGLGQIVQVGVRAAKHELGDTVAVIGLGLLGQIACQYARVLGVRTIIAIDTAPARLEFARLSGATHVLSMTAAEALESVRAITGGSGVDAVYDVTGNYRVLPTALPLLRSFGRLVMLGTTGSPEKQILCDDLVRRGLQIIGAHAVHAPRFSDNPAVWTTKRMHELFLHYLSTRQINVSSLITHTFAPDDAPKAYDLLERERATAMGVIYLW
jgi:threonine dehydrogenase-like Zn-dependent dehydrogenase